jgi:hypothetical protein
MIKNGIDYNERLMQAVMMQHFKPRINTVVPNAFWGAGLEHEADLLIVSPAGICTEIEIKTDKADLKKDCKKQHGHYSQKINYLYYCIPEYLEDGAENYIPENAGLFIVRHKSFINKLVVDVKRKAVKTTGNKWNAGDIARLERLGRLRAYDLLMEIIRIKYSVLL